MERFARRVDGFLRRYGGPAGVGGTLALAPFIMATMSLGEDRTDGERQVYCAAPPVTPGANRATACLYAVDADLEVLGMWAAAPTVGNFGVGTNSNLFPARGTLAGSVASAFNPIDPSSTAVPPAPLLSPERVEFGDFASLLGLGILAEFEVAVDETWPVPLPPFVLERGGVACMQRTDAGSARMGFVWRRLETEPPG